MTMPMAMAKTTTKTDWKKMNRAEEALQEDNNDDEKDRQSRGICGRGRAAKV